MTVKTSISLTDAQSAFARGLVAEGRYPSLSAVLQRGLDLVRQEAELREAEIAALRALLDERRQGPFIGTADSRRQIDAMVARKRAEHGLEGLSARTSASRISRRSRIF